MKSIRLGFGVLLMLAALILVGAPLFGGMAHAAGTPADTKIEFTVEAKYHDGFGQLPIPIDPVTITVKRVAGVEVTPTADRSQYAKPGVPAPFLVEITNTGNHDDTFDILPADESLPADWTITLHEDDNGKPGVPVLNPRAIGMDKTIKVWAKITPPADSEDGHVGTARVEATSTFNSNEADQSGELKVTVTDTRLVINATVVEAEAEPREEVTYTVTITNEGTGAATDITLYFPIPPGATFEGADKDIRVAGGDTCSATYDDENDRIVLTCAGLPADGEIELEFEVRIDAYVDPNTKVGADTDVTVTYTDTAEEDQTLSIPVPVVTVKTQRLVLVTLATNVADVEPGEAFKVKFTVKNRGNVNDTYDLSSLSVPHSWAWEVRDEAGTDPVADPVAIGKSQQLTLTLWVTVPTEEDGHEETATVTAQSQGDPTVEDSDSIVLTVKAPDLSGSLAADNMAPAPGEEVELTLTITNNGSRPANQTKAELLIPGHTTYKPDTITINGVQVTDDPGDNDGGHYDTVDKKVVVEPITLSNQEGSNQLVVKFKVTIN